MKHVISGKAGPLYGTTVSDAFAGKNLDALALDFTRCSGCREFLASCSCSGQPRRINVFLTRAIGQG